MSDLGACPAAVIARRRLVAAAVIAGLGFLTPANGFAAPTASQRVDAAADVTFVGAQDRTWIVELDVTGPSTGLPADFGHLDISLRSCAGQRCTAATTYRHPLHAGEFTADQKASTAALNTVAFGQRIKLNWSTNSDYQVSPTIVLYNHFVTGGGQAGILIPAVRAATASGQVFNRACHPTDAQTAIETDLGNIPAESAPTSPNRWPAAFAGISRARCR